MDLSSVVNASVVPAPAFSSALEGSGIATSVAFGACSFNTAVSVAGVASSVAFGTTVFNTPLLITPSSYVNTSAIGSPVFAFSVSSFTGTLVQGAIGTAVLTFSLEPVGIEGTLAVGTVELITPFLVEASSISNTSIVSDPTFAFTYDISAGVQTLTSLGDPVVALDTTNVTIGSVTNDSIVNSPIVTLVVDIDITAVGIELVSFIGDAELILSANPLGVETIVELGVPVFRQWSRASLIYTFLTSPKVIFRSRNHGNGF